MKNSTSVHRTQSGTPDAPGDLATKALRVSESRYRRLFETAQDGILLLNVNTAQIEDVNPYLIEMLGYSHAEFLGKKLWEVGSFADIAQSKEMFAELQAHGYVRYKDLPLKTKAGAIVPVEFVSNTYDCEGIKVIQCNIRNISERHADRAKIQRHTQLYAALSQCNKAIVHCASEEELFFQICRAAVQSGGVKMAWVGLIDPETRMVRPAASFGDDTEYLKDLNLSADADSTFECGPTGTAIGKNQPVWCQDFLNDPVTTPWHESAARAGLAASASLPLHRSGIVVGAFTIYSGDANSFDQSARDLLVEMAMDISFALDNFAGECRRLQAEEEIVFKNTILQTQLETSLDGILVVGEDGQIISYNQRFIDLWRLPPQIVSARLNSAMIQAAADQVENSELFVARVQYLNAHREDKSREEISLKDGRTIDQYSAPVAVAGHRHYGRVWYFRDITERKRLEQEKEQYFKFFMLSTNPMCIADPHGCFKRVNPAFLQLTGYSESELISKPFLGFVLPEDRQRTADEMTLQVGSRPSMHFENRYIRSDGTVIHLSWMGYFDRHDGVSYATANDITERKRAVISIKRLNRVYAVLSGINSLIVRVRDRDELFREACRIAVEEGGFRMSLIAIVDQTVMKIDPVASAGKSEELLSAIKGILSSSDTAPNTMAAQAIREKKVVVSNDSQKDPRVLVGKLYADAGVLSMAVLPLMVADEAVGVLALYASEREFFHEEEMKLLTELASDIAFAIDHLDKQARLDYLAYYDVLTGLANRTLFLERMAQYMRSAVSAGHQLALFLVDLERFKNINDSLGWPAGDDLLKQVAQWLTRNTAGDVNLLARVGVDHFAVVMPVVQKEGSLTRLLDQWIEAVKNHPFRLNDAVFRIAFKVGVALFPDEGADADTLFKNAEAALKKAKASGERYLFHTQTMTSSVADQLTLENQLRQALDKGEFVLHYQPKVNLASGRMTSAEALIRWNDPRTGLVPPGRFIPILEETGMIYEVGRWALRQAIEDCLRWRAAGLAAVRIAVNVSPLQLRNRGFIAEIEQAIAIDAHAPAGLELEITESLIMEDVKHSIASLQAIRAMGISIAIDDFGTGFSSLSYLAKLPVDTLKIDRSFVIAMTTDAQGLALVSTIISLAHALKLKVVAEGVETEEQARLLRLLSCDEMQGYLFSKPVPSDIFETKFLTLPPAG
jgi:diguanylate cyclase (GGDEF)-like protein/PAS domain S-box-containing protein